MGYRFRPSAKYYSRKNIFRFSWRQVPFRRGWPNRGVGFKRRLGLRAVRHSYAIRKMHEVLRNGDIILNNQGAQGYISMPSFGTGPLERRGKYTLLKDVKFSGTYKAVSGAPSEAREDVDVNAPMADVVGISSTYGLHGIATVYVVLDKCPHGTALPKFGDVFDTTKQGSIVDACPRNDQAGRFQLLGRKRTLLQDESTLHFTAFDMTVPMSRPIWVSFHDYTDDTRGGNYINTACNSILYFIAYDSSATSFIFVNMNSCISF